jgi:hypothetical protein
MTDPELREQLRRAVSVLSRYSYVLSDYQEKSARAYAIEITISQSWWRPRRRARFEFLREQINRELDGVQVVLKSTEVEIRELEGELALT